MGAIGAGGNAMTHRFSLESIDIACENGVSIRRNVWRVVYRSTVGC